MYNDILNEQISGNEEFKLAPDKINELTKILRRNGHGTDCLDFVKNYWPQAVAVCITAGTVAMVQREIGYGVWDKFTYGGIPFKVLKSLKTKLPEKKFQAVKDIFSLDTVKRLAKNNKKKLFIAVIFAAVGVSVTGYSLYDTYNKTASAKNKEELGRYILDVFSAVVQVPAAMFSRFGQTITDSGAGRAMGLQGNDCAPYVHALLAAVSAVGALALTSPRRPGKWMADAMWNVFTGQLKKAREGINAYTEKRIVKALEGRNLPPQLEDTLMDLPQTTNGYNEASKQAAKEKVMAIDLDQEYTDEINDVIDMVWDGKEGSTYVSKKVFESMGGDADSLARRADDQLRNTVEEAAQMGFRFDGQAPLAIAPPSANVVPDIVVNTDKAFRSGNVKEAMRGLEELAQFYRSINLLDDAAANLKANQIIEEIRKQFPEASDFDVMRLFLLRSGEVFSEISFTQAKGLAADLGKSRIPISDEAVEQIIAEQIDDVLRYQTSNLPAVPANEFPEMREASIESTMGFWSTLRGKVSPTAGITIAMIGFTNLFLASSLFSIEKNKPTGSPYYFKDDSIYAFLNSITGQESYKRFRDDMLSDKKAISQFMNIAFNTKNPKTQEFLEDLAKEKEFPLNVQRKVDEILKDFADTNALIIEDAIQDPTIIGLDAVGMQQVFGTQDIKTANKRLIMLAMVFEIFLYHDELNSRLVRYYNKVVQSGAGEEKKLRELKKIFRPSRAYEKASLEKIQKLEKYYANDNRIKSSNRNAIVNEVKIMSKKSLRELVSQVLNENSGQGYGKYPYHANEYNDKEPDQDYQVEWSALVDEVCGHKRKNVDGDPSTAEDMAVEVAKILVKDSDLFREVLETAGSNKSIGVEILQQIKDAKEKKSINKELSV